MNCDVLDRMLAAHGGSRRWFEFSKASAEVRIDGPLWESGSAKAFSRTAVEILTQEESVTLVSLPDKGIRSTFRPNVIQLETPGEALLETRYNPNSSFDPGAQLADWDRFQMAYVCSYSIWNCLTQPFLFSYSGFEIEDVPPIMAGTDMWRGIRITYPSYIAGPSRKVTCYVGEDGLMRRQDFGHRNLGGIGISSFMTDYAEIQGLRLPVLRSLYRTEDLKDGEEAALFATVRITNPCFS